MASSKSKSSHLTSSSATARSRRASSSSSSSSALASASASAAAVASSSSTKPLTAFSSSSDQIKSINRNLRLSSSSSAASTMTVDGVLSNFYATPSAESTLLDAQITLIDTPAPLLPETPPPQPLPPATIETNHTNSSNNQEMNSDIPQASKTVDDVWREIVAGRKEMKEEPDEMMTLEDFLAKTGAVEVGEDEVKMPPPERLSGGVYAFDPVPPSAFQMLDKVEGSIVGFGNEVEVAAGRGGSGVGRGKRGRTPVMEPLDRVAQQRQRRMIKNRESAARSRERKQAYQVELESLAVRLEEENEQLLKEKEERTKERFQQLMEKVVPVVEKRRPPRRLRRVHSLQW
ncbi:hypothetical protein P3X46_028429 [Hevea brasiliensis]|uniref:BZIP domain-containing protein n=2 Tax=Hevea brasiliensis TaxID=3981 RepID=A0ABQ9KQF8_HEVBR|nr:G-box-binding factor 4 isoform X2 [Hevea brasiliensis]KAJ9146122.1 hypothetical protein P3X46_028429 [Hevea brasiliensis]